MNSTSSSKWLIRLLILCVLSVALLFSLQEQEANALVFSCGEDLNHCTFNCALAHQNDVQAYHACRMGCLDAYDACSFCTFNSQPPDCAGSYDIPEPYPVVANYTMCMDECANCLFLPLMDVGDCYTPCKVHCIETYAQ